MIRLHPDNRWTTAADDREFYGRDGVPFNDSTIGALVKTGALIKSYTLLGRITRDCFDDVELVIMISTPQSSLEDGIDMSSQFDHVELYRGLFFNDNGKRENLKKYNLYQRTFEIPHNLRRVKSDSLLNVFMRPVGESKNSSIFYTSRDYWDIR